MEHWMVAWMRKDSVERCGILIGRYSDYRDAESIAELRNSEIDEEVAWVIPAGTNEDATPVASRKNTNEFGIAFHVVSELKKEKNRHERQVKIRRLRRRVETWTKLLGEIERIGSRTEKKAVRKIGESLEKTLAQVSRLW